MVARESEARTGLAFALREHVREVKFTGVWVMIYLWPDTGIAGVSSDTPIERSMGTAEYFFFFLQITKVILLLEILSLFSSVNNRNKNVILIRWRIVQVYCWRYGTTRARGLRRTVRRFGTSSKKGFVELSNIGVWIIMTSQCTGTGRQSLLGHSNRGR